MHLLGTDLTPLKSDIFAYTVRKTPLLLLEEFLLFLIAKILVQVCPQIVQKCFKREPSPKGPKGQGLDGMN